MAIAANTKWRPLFYNKNNEIIVKLNNNALAEEIKKQALKKVIYRINVHLIENNITITKLRPAQILPSRDITIQTTNEKEAEKLRKENGWTKMLGNKAKLTWK